MLAILAAVPIVLTGIATGDGPAVAISFDREARAVPVTGRVYVAFSKDARRPPIREAGPRGVPLFGMDVTDLAPGETAIIGPTVFGHPVRSLLDLPKGRYWVQGFINVYTRFHRSDGHTIYLHMDQGEGQDWRRSPGNLYSRPVEVDWDPESPDPLLLVCDHVIPPIEFPEDTDYVKRFRIRSERLTKFWGTPIEIGATVLLPHGYDENPGARYPVCYVQGHYSLAAPGGFGRGRDFDRFWTAPGTPRFLMVTFQHPTPYYDDSYAVNSENNGPYGDALVHELIPEVERRFRAIGEPWARTLTGGSTGGWECLALQIFYPDFFNGCWSLCPDPVDFRAYQLVNIYDDENAYYTEYEWIRVERPTLRATDGSVLEMMKDENHYELVVGEKSRSGGQWDIWEAVFGPVGEDGYPKRIWDKRTGEIDHEVAEFWRRNYDLRYILETQWKELGPKLAGKLHFYVGDMDSYYLNNAVKLMEDFLEQTRDPHYGGSVTYKDGKGHCWGPTYEELLPKMADWITRTAPDGADTRSWRH